MRRLMCLLVAIAAMCGAGGARATIEPPVHVRILGTPRAAEPGVPFVGQLQIESGFDATLAGLKFGGSGWRQLSLAAAPTESIDKGRPLVFDFSVVTNDPGQWLDLSFDVDGTTITRSFMLSPEAVAIALHPGATIPMKPNGDVPPLTEANRVSPEPLPSEPTAAPDASSAVKSRSIRIHGRFTYQRTDGYTAGADGMTVRVYDDNLPLPPVELAVDVTDAQGWYDVTFTWNGNVFDSEPDLYVRFETANSRVQVESPVWLAGYSWQSGTSWNDNNTDKDFGWMQPSDFNQHAAVHAQTTLTRTWRWWMGYGYDTPFVRCNWPGPDTGSFYAGEIYLTGGDGWNEDTISHEYGHHWVGTYASSPMPVYCNGFCDNSPIDCGHCLWCPETETVAFTEGFPDWMGDVIPGSFGAAYGRDALSVYDMENLYTCDGVTPDDPLRTEGFLAAVVRDIGDDTNDNDPRFAGADQLSVGWGPAITCVDLDAPTTATGFLAAFRARYPAWGKDLWATARNCKYETDLQPPTAVTGLHSTSHSTSGDSPDGTIDLAWTAATDDISGIIGYGISVNGTHYIPSDILDIYDVTSYTTPTLAPGTYYFNIRAVDYSGKWSDTYAWCGPYTIRGPLAANLAVYQFGGWDKVLVPRATNDADFSSVPAPATLPGNAASTYWNVGLWNSGESATGAGFDIRAYVDGAWNWWVWSNELGIHWSQYGCNLGPLTVRGGRHTLETRLDGTEVIAEINESDNRWAHQWVWSPLQLAAGTPVVRSAPPLKTAGWDAVVDASPVYYNSDGLRIGAASYWDAAVLRPLSAATDDDLYLHTASTGATDGFSGTLAGSARGSGLIEAVVVNRNTMGWNSQDVGVINSNGNGSSYEVVHAVNASLAFGDSVNVAFSQNQMLRIFEFHVGAANAGPVSFTITTDPNSGPLYAQWLDKNFQTGGLYTYASGTMTDTAGSARMDVTIPDAGYNALLVYRDPDWKLGNGPLNVTIEIEKTPPDFQPKYMAGWYAPIVPRAAFDGTAASVPAPTTLPGNAPSTYLNMASCNESPSASPLGLKGHIYFDGNYSAWVAWGGYPAYGYGLYIWDFPWTISGGRHTLAWKLDADQEIEEIHEDNNDYAEQWVWSPLALVNDTPVVRSMPTDPYGGWTGLSTGEPFYPNCDGLRMPNAGGYWRAVAAMPGVGSDVDLRLHPASTGAKNGFAANVAGSFWSGDASDYVLVDFNLAAGGFAPYDAGVVRYQGAAGYTAESTATSGWLANPNGVYGPYSLPANRILNLVEVYLPAGQTGIHLMNVTGTVDWGVSLHLATAAYQGKSDVVGTSYFGGGAGGDEVLVANVPAAGWYCIAVWKTTASELVKAGTYKLLIKPMWASGVDDPVPSPKVTALVDITPNPFNPQTKITFDLAAEGAVRLEVYDVQGHLVRTLVDGPRGVGRHTETWSGVDDGGGRVASGVYLARLTAGGVTGMMKMMLLK